MAFIEANKTNLYIKLNISILQCFQFFTQFDILNYIYVLANSSNNAAIISTASV